MENTKDLNSAIYYFEQNKHIIPYAAQVVEWLRDLKVAKEKIQMYELLKKNNANTGEHISMGFGSDGGMSSLMLRQNDKY